MTILARPFRSSLAALIAFGAGAVVTNQVGFARRRAAPERRTEEPAATQVREVQHSSPVLEAPATPPAAAAIPLPARAIALPTAPPAPAPADDEREADSAAFSKEVQQLRDEVARLKQDLGQARTDSQTTVLLDLDRQAAGIRAQLAASQAQREEDSEATREAAAQRHRAVLMLFAANGRLAAGESDVVDSLEAAAPALPYPAQTALRNARESIKSEDLYTARYWISVAILESGWSQISQ